MAVDGVQAVVAERLPVASHFVTVAGRMGLRGKELLLAAIGIWWDGLAILRDWHSFRLTKDLLRILLLTIAPESYPPPSTSYR